MKTLDGLQILITRPQAQARRWQTQLRALGADTVLLPVLAIVPVAEKPEQQAIKNIAARLPDFDKIIFVSQNAVQQARHYFSRIPANCALFAIGKTTAAAMAPWGQTVKAAEKAMNSEDLLALPALQSDQTKNERVLICRGTGGRTTLGDTLRQRGATVEYCELYYRQHHPEAVKQLRQFLNAAGNRERLSVVSSHSGESLRYWRDTIARAGDNAKALMDWPLLVPGERVAALAKQQGFGQVICAANASDEIMTQTLVDWWRQRGRS